MSLQVCLVNMPFSAVERPSIGLSLLQSALRTAKIETRLLYANIAFAEQVGPAVNQLMCNLGPEKLLGEWVFAASAFPEMARAPGDIDALARAADPNGRSQQTLGGIELTHLLWELRRFAPIFVEQMAQVVIQTQPRIVGCTSLFQQHTAALALLRRIRQLAPDVVTMLGGANCEGPMGQVITRGFPWVDVVVSGEADELIVPLCQSLLRSGRTIDPQSLPHGAMTSVTLQTSSDLEPKTGPGSGLKNGAEIKAAPRAKVRDMNRLPIPDYDDYFLALQASPLGRWAKPALLMETSRGCWWGEVAHCTFCGLNGSGMRYRAKSPERALFELDALAARYRIQRFEMVDNILDMGYFKSLMPILAQRDAPYALFYETKANLKREQVEQLVRGGVHAIQPGIESLHDEALERVDKGCTLMQNLQLLKWSRQYGLKVIWNLLTGLPGEHDSWWAETADWLELVEHFEPPSGVTPIHFQRYSPYHFRAADFGLDLAPHRVYRHLFPLPESELSELAYYFEDRAGAVPAQGEGRRRLEQAVDQWRAHWTPEAQQRPRLEMLDHSDGSLQIIDTRRCASTFNHHLHGVQAQLYRELIGARKRDALSRRLIKLGFKLGEVEAAVEDLHARRLIIEHRGKLLALATEANPAPRLDSMKHLRCNSELTPSLGSTSTAVNP